MFVSLLTTIGCGNGLHHPAGSLKVASSAPGVQQSFIVTAAGAPDNFTIDNTDGSSLTLQRGKTYNFVLKVPGHPFYIMTVDSPNPINAYTKGVVGNGKSSGTLVFTVPSDAPDTLSYNCSIHAAMSGPIAVVN